LVRLYWPVELRPAFDALFDIDDALGAVVTSSTQPALGAIRLAWWREALERLDRLPPPPEPRLQAVAVELLPRGITGKEVAALEDGWATLLDEAPDPARIAERGARLFRIAARLLCSDHEMLDGAGRLYADVDVARREHWDLARDPVGLGGTRFPRRLRPLTAWAALAARDLRRGGPPFESEATPGRALALLRHRLFGRVA
jgi:15-cis-phytoene synthase